MSTCSTSNDAVKLPTWLLEDLHRASHADQSEKLTLLVPCAICLRLMYWNLTFSHPLVASHCIRVCKDCLQFTESRRLQLAEQGQLFSLQNPNERICGCCSLGSFKMSEWLFPCSGCTRSFCKVCVTRILGEYAVATGLVQLNAWFCPLCVRCNITAKETFKNSRKDQFVLVSLVSFAQANNWKTPIPLPALQKRVLTEEGLTALSNVCSDLSVIKRYDKNFERYCRWLDIKEHEKLEKSTVVNGGALRDQVDENTQCSLREDSPLCFWCKEPNASITCSFPRCSKTYHRHCIMAEIVEGADWICPWHACVICGAVESNENILEKCRTCPLSFCSIHLPNDSQGEIYYYPNHYILCHRCTPLVERPHRKTRLGRTMDRYLTIENHDGMALPNKHISLNIEGKRLRRSTQDTVAVKDARGKHTSSTMNTVQLFPTERETNPTKRNHSNAQDGNGRLVRLVQETLNKGIKADMNEVLEFVREDVDHLGGNGACRLALVYVLKKEQRALSTSEIAELMVTKGLWLPQGSTPINTVAGLLSSDSKKVRDKVVPYVYFDRTGPSLFQYNRYGKG
eukprot:jgi/Galph1/5061/GphlegSOOS_G3697.1